MRGKSEREDACLDYQATLRGSGEARFESLRMQTIVNWRV